MTSKPYLADTILLADDEPLHLGFLIDYFESKKYSIKLAETADDAIFTTSKDDYRAYIVDLNIPASGTLLAKALNKNLETNFPGITIARSILTSGVSAKRVLIYSVHLTDALYEEIQKLGLQYVQKGRPKIIKNAIDSILSFDPKAK